MDSGQIPPFPHDSSQPEDSGHQKQEHPLPEARRYTPDTSITSRHDLTALPDYEISSSEPLPDKASAQLPDSCPDWFKAYEDLFQELAQYQQYFTDTTNQEAFLNGDGPCYNPLIITRLRLETINLSALLTNEKKITIEQWQDAALKDCPIPWRTLPLKLNHLNEEWVPSPQASRFIELDKDNRVSQMDAGDFIPDWMRQEVLGILICEVTTQYWNLRNKHAQPGKNFLTIDRLKSKDPVLHNWLALFKDPRVPQEAGLSDRQVAVVNYRLSFADQEIAKFLKKKKCKTKSHLYTWGQIPAESGLYEQVQQQLKEPSNPERLKKKRTRSSHSKTSPEASSDKSVSPKKRSQDSLTPRHSIPDISVNSSELNNEPFLMVNGKKHPYSEDIKHADTPDVQRRLKTYEKPHMYDFETASEEQIPKWRPSSSMLTPEPDSPQRTKVAFDEIEVAEKLFPVLGINSTRASVRIPVEQVIRELESTSHLLYHTHKQQEAVLLLNKLKQLQNELLVHFDRVYQQHTAKMYASADKEYRLAQSNHEKTPELESLLSKDQHDMFEKILAAQDELHQLKSQAEYYLKRVHQERWVRSETWHTAELLRCPMAKTRECLLAQTGISSKTLPLQDVQVSVPAQLLSKLKYLEEISYDRHSEQVDISSVELCRVIVKNLILLKKCYSNNIEVWDPDAARKECDDLLVIFDYFIEYLKPKRAEDAIAFNNYLTMENLRADFQNFRHALKEADHTEMRTILSNRMKGASEVIKRLSTKQ